MFFIGMKGNKQKQFAQGISLKDVCSNWQNSQITEMIVLSLILHRKCAKKAKDSFRNSICFWGCYYL